MYDWVVVMDCCCEELWWLYVVVTLCCGDFKVWWLYVTVTLCFGDLMLWWLYVVMILKYCECIYCGNFMVCANFRCDFLVWWHDVMNSYCDDFHVVVTVKSTCCGSLMILPCDRFYVGMTVFQVDFMAWGLNGVVMTMLDLCDDLLYDYAAVIS